MKEIFRNRRTLFEIDFEERVLAGRNLETGERILAKPDLAALLVLTRAACAFLSEGQTGFARLAEFFTYGKRSDSITYQAENDENVFYGLGLTSDHRNLRVFVSRRQGSTVTVVLNRTKALLLADVLLRFTALWRDPQPVLDASSLGLD